ncbi:hypothetical protein OAF54_01690 [bacterium]|nr:hypothetical protein [bacterium]
MRTFQQGISKEQLVNNLKAHQKADEFIQGRYWRYGKGCAVGCSIIDFEGCPEEHSEFERLFGIPQPLARLEDGIFEGLSIEDSKWWPVAFAEAVPIDADLSMVLPKFMVWLLEGVKHYAKPDGVKAIDRVIELYKLKITGENPERELWIEARKAAADAASDAAAAAASDAASDAASADYAADAAYAASAASAASAAYAAYAAYADAADAAYAAYAAYAASDAAAAASDASAAAAVRQQKRKEQADKLIELLKAV